MVIISCSIICAYYVQVISPTREYVCQNSPEEGLAGQSAHSLSLECATDNLRIDDA